MARRPSLSCAEYNNPEIDSYVRKVNKVSDSYPISRLCTEDAVSVSRLFSHQFHSFFQTVIIKGEVLGRATDYFCKEEYQSRGAPHYHILLWIEGAPVAGTVEDEVVLKWIQEKLPAAYQKKRAILNYTSWSPSNSTTNVILIVDIKSV